MIKYRSVFISDVHLGTKMSQANKLLDFLKTFESEKIYLVGDFIDGWALSRSFYWPREHNDVIQKLLRKARKGTEVYYIAGNHDEFLRIFGDHSFGDIHIVDEVIHQCLNGKKYMVTHGDHFDAVITKAKWLAHLGSWAYDLSIALNTFVTKIRNIFKLPYWSLSAWAKYKVKEAVNYIGDYEASLAKYAELNNVDGIICGHIHHANITSFNGIDYLNCGDVVESCTCIVEDMEGNFSIVKL